MGVGFAGFQFERSQGDRIRLETVVERDFLVEDTVTTDGVNRAQLAAERIHDGSIVIPSAHAQCLLAVEVAIRIGCREIGQAEDTFIDNSQSVGHSLLVGLVHFHLDGLLGVGRFGSGDIGLQQHFLVLHLHRHHAVEADRQVVVGIVRLDQGHVDIHIRNHLVGSGDFHLAFRAEILEQHGLHHLFVGFHRDQRLSLLVGGEGDDNLLAHLIAVGSGLHDQLCRSPRSRRSVTIAPVEGDDFGEHIAALLVVDDEEVAAPFIVRDVEGNRGRAVAGQRAVLHGSLVGARGIALQVPGVLARPPPVGIQLVEGIFEGDSRLVGGAVFAHHSDVELPVLVGVVVAAVFRSGLRQLHTHITAVGRDLRLERGDAEVAARLEDLHREGAVHHL